jgi:hypothetical protein
VGRTEEPAWLVRVLEWFEKDPGDALVGRAELHGATLRDLQRPWGLPADDPMVDCYPVGEMQRDAVAAWAGMTLDLERADYFVSCYTRDWAATKRDGGYMGSFPPPETPPAFPHLRPTKPR